MTSASATALRQDINNMVYEAAKANSAMSYYAALLRQSNAYELVSEISSIDHALGAAVAAKWDEWEAALDVEIEALIDEVQAGSEK